MTYTDYCFEGPAPVAEITHECFIENTTVTCNYLFCIFAETCDTVEDAETLAAIHEGV